MGENNDLSIEEIRKLITVETVLSALLDKLDDVAKKEEENRNEMAKLTEMVNTLSGTVDSLSANLQSRMKTSETTVSQLNTNVYNNGEDIKRLTDSVKSLEKKLDGIKPEKKTKEENNSIPKKNKDKPF